LAYLRKNLKASTNSDASTIAIGARMTVEIAMLSVRVPGKAKGLTAQVITAVIATNKISLVFPLTKVAPPAAMPIPVNKPSQYGGSLTWPALSNSNEIMPKTVPATMKIAALSQRLFERFFESDRLAS
jgi:hypothetical protein